MPFAAALSTAVDTDQAIEEVAWQVRSHLGSGEPHLACVFYSPTHAGEAGRIATALNAKLQPGTLLGCLGESIVGGSREIEKGPAIALWAAKWDEPVEIESFHMHADRTGDGPSIMGWPDVLFEANLTDAAMLIFGDPFTFPVAELFLPQMNEDYPGVSIIGGMASNPNGPEGPCLIRNTDVHTQGAVGVVMRGMKWRCVVSQGCKPIGRPMVVTKGQDNIVAEIGGLTPLAYLRQLREELPEHDRELFQNGLLVGIALSEYRDKFGSGDFLIRNLYAIDRNTGVMAITDRIRVGQTIQFHLRDAETADEDFRAMLEQQVRPGYKPRGGLMFTCNGRGTRMFPAPHHDAALMQSVLGPLPLAGFFAAGELGPVSGKNFIHGFTTSAILFE